MTHRRFVREAAPTSATRGGARIAAAGDTCERASNSRSLQRSLGNRALVSHRRPTLARSPREAGALAQRARTDRSIQRMVGINSANIHGEIVGLIGNPMDMAKLTEAYTFLQHIDWSHNIVGGNVFDLGAPAFNGLGTNENLILVARGAAGSSGGYNGTQLANRLGDVGTGVPPDWAARCSSPPATRGPV